MIVTPAPGRASVSTNGRRGFFSINAGEIQNVPASIALPLLEKGLLIKAEYPEIQNDVIVVVDTGRAIGKPTMREKRGLTNAAH